MGMIKKGDIPFLCQRKKIATKIATRINETDTAIVNLTQRTAILKSAYFFDQLSKPTPK